MLFLRTPKLLLLLTSHLSRQINIAFPKLIATSGFKMPLKYLSQQEAMAIDEELFSEFAFSVDQLMELAGLSCATAIAQTYPRDSLKLKGRALVVSGPGNNGGDGLVCARHLKMFGFSPSLLYPKPSNGQLMKNLQRQLELMNIESIKSIYNAESVSLQYDLIVDAIFGFSFKPPIREPFDKILGILNEVSIPVISIDIPSGWDVEKGPLDETKALKPDCLISLTAPKLGARYFKGKHNILGGRFVPEKLAQKYALNLPQYPGTAGFIRL